MGFLDHFNDHLTDMINESRTGEYASVIAYGYNWIDYINGELGPINFWSSEQIDENMEDIWFSLNNPLVVENPEYEMGDMSFETECVGYAVNNGHDSIIIESNSNTFYITIDFDEQHSDVGEYIAEADDKKISAKTRKELQAKRKQAAPRRPKKAPAKGMKVDIMLANTGRLSPDRVERGMKQVRKQPPKITGAKEVQGSKYFRAEYNFKSKGSPNRQMGYADISNDKVYCKEVFCTCSDFFYRLYAPYVAAGLSTWNIPPKFKSKQTNNVKKSSHNHKWTVHTNPQGKLFLCKHLWAFLAYYVAGDTGNVELSDEEIDDVIDKYFTDVDGDGDEEATDTEFMKAYGKLYVGQKGKDIEHIEDPEEAKKRKGKKQTYYQLPQRQKKKVEPEKEPEETEEEE